MNAGEREARFQFEQWVEEQIATYRDRRRVLLTEWLLNLRGEIDKRLELFPGDPGLPWGVVEPLDELVLPVLLLDRQDQPSILMGLAPAEPGGKMVRLAANETQVLVRLAEAYPDSLTTEMLVAGVWDSDNVASKAFLSLRDKIGDLVCSKGGQKGGRWLTRRIRVCHRNSPPAASPPPDQS